MYFLIHEGEIVYVGKASDLSRRLHHHGRYSQPFEQVYFIGTPKMYADVVECYYIHSLLPYRNNYVPPIDSSIEDLLQ